MSDPLTDGVYFSGCCLTQLQRQGWGSGVVGRLADDLRVAFPDMTGISYRNLQHMRAFAAAWADQPIVQQTATKLPWGHIMVLIDKLIHSFVTQTLPRGAIRGVQAEVEGYRFGREGAGKMNGTTAKPDFTDAELQFLDSVFKLAREGHTGELMSLVSSGIPVNLTNSRGDTLLILAAYHRRADTVSALLSASADTSRVNDMGQTALAAATFRCDPGIVRALLRAGADPHLGPKSAIAVAQQFGLTDMATLFT